LGAETGPQEIVTGANQMPYGVFVAPLTEKNGKGVETAIVTARPAARVPRWVRFYNVIARRLLALGIRIGPDALITVPGRRTGIPRSTPVTICQNVGRRGLISPFGETHWVRNLRRAGRATLTFGRLREEVTAVELGPQEAAAFIRDVLAPHARRTRLGEWFVRNVDKIDIDHPEAAARGKPVFEIYRA
jgi:deazaflavin-dependent oxidoreductase (nitroreductase family)